MPIPSSEDFRNRTKTNAQMREMLAEMAGSVASKDYVSNTGFGFISGNTRSSINYVTATRTLEFTGEVIVSSATAKYNITTPQSVNLPAWTPYRLEYNIDTGLIERIDHKLSPSVGKISLAIVSATDQTLNTSDFSFTVDGIIQSPPQDGKLITSTAGRINFKNASSELIIHSGVRLKTPTTSVSMSDVAAGDLIISYSGLSGPYNLVFNLKSKKFSFISTIGSLDPNSVIVALCHFVSGQVVDIFGIDVFTSDRPKTYDPHNGELIVLTPSAVSIDTAAKTISFANTVRVKSPYVSIKPSTTTPTVVNLPTTSDVYILIYNIASNTLSFVPDYNPQPTNTVKLATFYMSVRSGVVSITRIEGISQYILDGQRVEASPVFSGVITSNNDSSINFDFVNDKLIISGRLNYADKTVLLELIEVDITPIDNAGFWQRVLYNTITRTFLTKRTTVSLEDGEIQVGMFQKSSKRVVGFPGYYVNGSQPLEVKSDLITAQFLHPYGDLDANYIQPTLSDYRNVLIVENPHYDTIYDLYDSLMASHPSYITKKHIGDDAVGNPLYQYQFSTPEVISEVNGAKKPKVIIFSNIHGWEKAGTMNTYLAMKEVCERWQDDTKLEALKWGVNFVVVPVCNPSGFAASGRGTRKNHNGVDLARNFSSGWAVSSPESQTYGGEYAMSELETQHMDSVLEEHKDAICFISHHNFEGLGVTETMPRGAFIWVAGKSNFSVNIAKSLLIKTTIEAKKKYTWMPEEDDYYVGYSDLTLPAGSESRQAQDRYGIQSSTFEICDRMVFEPEAQRLKYSSAVATVGVESLINWILLNVKHACDLYNSRINL